MKKYIEDYSMLNGNNIKMIERPLPAPGIVWAGQDTVQCCPELLDEREEWHIAFHHQNVSCDGVSCTPPASKTVSQLDVKPERVHATCKRAQWIREYWISSSKHAVTNDLCVHCRRPQRKKHSSSKIKKGGAIQNV